MNTLKSKIKQSFLTLENTLRDAINSLDKTELKICFVIDKNKKLIGSITDGDIRRGLIKNLSVDDKIKRIVNKNPIYVNQNMSYQAAKLIMKSNQILQIPVINKKKQIMDIHLWDNTDKEVIKNSIVIMAGGFGKRLRPLTLKTPKPMLKISNKPLLEFVILNAKNNGFKNFIICTHYKHKQISNYFKDGKNLGVSIKYLKENKPLGTAGSIKRIKSNHPLVVINGDVVSNINFKNLLDYHNKNKSYATMVVRNYEQINPFGVVKLTNNKIISLEEKKTEKTSINAGIYVLNNNVKKIISGYTDMTDLFIELIKRKKKVLAFPLHENWLDIGTKQTLKKLRKDKNSY